MRLIDDRPRYRVSIPTACGKTIKENCRSHDPEVAMAEVSGRVVALCEARGWTPLLDQISYLEVDTNGDVIQLLDPEEALAA